ncbi:hypothetical protein C0Q70_14971 [Pomacea canaliculata]|uniref:Uncharacterized protein n=1 Tax=Pomacea canaliculata TaxID=400727 RepID=A0A2T7NTI3_POMCA|nr:hypothetical protein C0Q70_14971 [Pomacea canaliculata]
MEFVRSEPARLRNGSIINPRRHENVLTSFIDASMVYGSDLSKVLQLRDNGGKEALLKTSFYRGKERLPQGKPDVCINDGPDHYCALAGDDRVNEQPGLTAIHTVFHLEHNRLVRKLVADILVAQGRRSTPLDIAAYIKTAPLLVKEKLFQTVRKILIAVWQKVVYGEYLPIILGPDIMTKFQLWTGSRVNFDPHVDPSISNAFSSAAFRFGHTLIANVFHMDKDHILKDMFSESSHILEKYESMCEGLVSWNNAAETFNRHLADSITNHLFANNRMNKTGLDLASLNLQRGRDHGTAGINAYRKYFGLRPYQISTSFGTALSIFEPSTDDVDLFTGGTCERSVKKGIVGETFAHILGQQFHDLKFGDKYFFETSDQRYGFTTAQLISITKLSMSKILCSNGGISYIQEKPFHQANYYYNPLVPCDELPDIDLTYWVSEFSY